MIDFDDLEETAAEKMAAGEELDADAALAVGRPEAPDAYRGAWLPPLPHNRQFPGRDVLSERLRESFGAVARSPLVRLFVFYGAGDSFPFWAQFMHECPEWVEPAVYEWPGHGSREDEPQPDSCDGLAADAMEGLLPALKQHAKGGSLEGAPFALAGHSIGASILVAVAHRALLLLGIEPAVVFILDRGAPHLSFASAKGQRLLDTDPAEFIRIFNPGVFSLWTRAKERDPDSQGTATARKAMDMWCRDIQLQSNTKEEGYHQFRCPVHVFVAMQQFAMDSSRAQANMNDAQRAYQVELDSIMGSRASSSALFDMWGYMAWEGWTSGPCEIHRVDCDHLQVKAHPDVLKTMMSALKAVRVER